MKKIFALSTLIIFGCVTQPTKKSSFSPVTDKTLQQHAAANKIAQEVAAKLGEKFNGKELYLTSQVLCDARPISAMEYKLEKEAREEKSRTMPVEERLKYLQEQRNSIKEGVEKEYAKKEVKALSKVKVEEVKAFVNYINVQDENRSFSHKEGEVLKFKWNGSADLFFVVSSGSDKFVVNKSFFETTSALNQPLENLLFDTNKVNSDIIDCFSKANPMKKYGLSAKDKNAIDRSTYYIGMPEMAFVLTRGRPGKINNTTTAAGSTQQWVYGNNYFYFSNQRLRSWQN